ncbi:MAG: cytochrome c [Caldimonas sp.]
MTSRRAVWALGAVAVLVVAALVSAAAIAWLSVRDGSAPQTGAPAVTGAVGTGPGVGEYLVRAGNCEGCHTARGGARFAGGRAIETPFGIVFSSNLTPDASGLGGWSSDDFWRALHNGRSRDGHLLYPAFPYPNYTGLARADADAMFAYLKTVTPVAQANKAHALGFPFDQQAALAVWRALFFRPASFQPEPSRSPDWNRGAYLVETLGHCNACHSQRNVFGATADPLDLAGGLIPMQNWYAPSLTDAAEASVADWPVADIVALLKTGVTERATVQGPMAEVVAGSTQYLHDSDLAAMATYLKALPVRPVNIVATDDAAAPAIAAAGQQLYETHCSACHGDQGAGVAGAYPALAGNRAVALTPAVNLVHVVLRGGFAPSTAGNPRPFGMPPFATVLTDAEVASVLTYLRSAWGNRAAPITTLDVSRYRGAAD